MPKKVWTSRRPSPSPIQARPSAWSTGRDLGLPFALSFTVETDGRLPTGQDLDSALSEVEAATGGYVRYYGINCAHPEHFGEQLPSRWLNRIGMVRPNASRRSHAELDEATELDDGDPQEFALR